ncbi:MAG: hypothetical protein ACRCX2_18365 [Paraclostridium sp.]
MKELKVSLYPTVSSLVDIYVEEAMDNLWSGDKGVFIATDGTNVKKFRFASEAGFNKSKTTNGWDLLVYLTVDSEGEVYTTYMYI